MLWLAWLGCGKDPAPSSAPCTSTEPQAPIPRQLRLLTRREYDDTVADLLPELAAGPACHGDGDCDATVASCVAGNCEPDPCALHTFAFPSADGGEGSVAVAGTFDGWSPTAWPMTWLPSQRQWVAKQTLADGRYDYKFVIDGSIWEPDPLDPVTESDGYGGVNSVLVQDCSAAAPPPPAFDPASTFPAESPPRGFAFLDSAETGLVTTVHAEQYGEAAASLAAQAAADLPGLLGCPSPGPDCVEPWVASFGRRAFRRPLTHDEVDRYTALAGTGSSLSAGVSTALEAMLQSPYFLYRSEVGSPEGDHYELDGPEIASAMSYFLWQSMPDEELLAAGEAGDLADPGVRAKQARRLLEDPRARATVREFATEWLDLAEVPSQVRVDPEFQPALGTAMVDEAADLVESTLFDGSGRVRDLLLADLAPSDPALRALYALDPPDADPPQADRVGLLGTAAILTATSHSDQSSPIRRGLFVRERLLCETLPIPPPNVGPVPVVSPDATTRDRFAQHTADPFCASCHTRIDPVGFALEGFDEIGRYRAEENGLPVDTTGFVADLDGPLDVVVDGERELSLALADSDAYRRCFAVEAWRFAAGRLEGPEQQCAIDAIDRASGGDMASALVEVVRSPEFIRRSEP